MARYVGRAAEKRFSALCSDNGITCNEPDEDENGWDHIVEFTQISVTGVSTDMQRALPAVFVQTKSHKAAGLKVTMKLSNALKLARNPAPCFVVLMSRTSNGTNSGWYAAHFWEALIGRVLKRAREASRDGIPETELHKQSFSFTMKASDARTDQDLLSWMEQTVRSVGHDYASVKAALHSDRKIVGKLNFGPLSSIEQLVDHSIGLTSSIAMQSIEMNTRRFGIDLPLPIPTGPPVFAAVQSHPAAQCDIRLRGPDGFEMELTGDVVVPGIPNLPDEHKKVRFRTSILDMVWTLNGQASIKGNLSTQLSQSPAEIEQMVRFASWSGQGDIMIRVNVKDMRLLDASARMDTLPDQPQYAYLLGPVGSLVKTSRHLKNQIPQISLDDILASEWVIPFHNFLAAKDMNASAPLTAEVAGLEISSAIAAGIAPVGDWIFAAIQRFPIASEERENGMWRIEFGVPILLETYAFNASNGGAMQAMKNDYLRLAAQPGTLVLDNVLPTLTPVAGKSPHN